MTAQNKKIQSRYLIENLMSFASSFTLISMLALTMLGCGSTFVGNPDDDKDKKPTNTGNDETTSTKPSITVALTDAPVDGATAVWVGVEKVRVLAEDGTWSEIKASTTDEINLMSYQGVNSLDIAKSSELAAGTYKRIELVLSKTIVPRLVLENGEEHDLRILGPDYSMILDKEFELVAGVEMKLTIDIDLRRSIVEQGNGEYHLKPITRMVENKKSGHVKGIADKGKVACVYTYGQVLDEKASCETAIASLKVTKGTYTLGFLAEGYYNIRIFSANGSYVTVEEVHVVGGQTTEL